MYSVFQIRIFIKSIFKIQLSKNLALRAGNILSKQKIPMKGIFCELWFRAIINGLAYPFLTDSVQI